MAAPQQEQAVPAPEVPSVVVGKKNGEEWEFATVLKGKFSGVTRDPSLARAVEDALSLVLMDSFKPGDIIQMEIKIIREGE